MQIHVLSKTAKVTASKGNVSEMIDLSKNAVKLLESCKCPKTVPDMISDGDLHCLIFNLAKITFSCFLKD